MATIALTVNGVSHLIDIDPEMPLLWALRDILGLIGTKYSCGMGLCGTCTVHVNGALARSCITPVSAVSDKEIITIEGLAENGSHPLQKAWIEEDVSQCGYCQPGQIMAAAALLAAQPSPTDTDIDEVMNGVLCRCGTYQRIRKAIHRAAGGAA